MRDFFSIFLVPHPLTAQAEKRGTEKKANKTNKKSTRFVSGESNDDFVFAFVVVVGGFLLLGVFFNFF